MKKTEISQITLNISTDRFTRIGEFIEKHAHAIIVIVLSIVSIAAFYYYYQNGLGLAYNDARSHLDIGRRVVEGLKPGFAQLGSVWLPLPHLLMTITIWNDFMWHSGLAGAIISMISFVLTGLLIYKFLKHLKVPLIYRFIGVVVFATNINILYLQSTAMTELLLIATMTFASYELLKWGETKNVLNLIKSAFYIMLSTLVRYDGWFLLFWAAGIITLIVFSDEYHANRAKVTENIKAAYKKTEGTMIMFLTLACFGIGLWLLWNLLIFKDPLYFATGPFSAKSQQDQLEVAGVLQTKHDIFLSIKFYFYALVYNSNAFMVFLAIIGAIALWTDKKLTRDIRLCSTALIAPLFFNIIALYFGHSVLFIQGLSGDTWFNVRYGIMLMPAISVFIAYLFYKVRNLKAVLIPLLFFVIFFSFASNDAVTIDDARVGSSQKNVSEVSGWLAENAKNQKGYILISAASHDAIIFSSGLPMKRFIHEGTGDYWDNATTAPDRWAKWIIVRTYDDNDLTWKSVNKTGAISKYNLVDHFPFADIYELKPEFQNQLPE